MSNLVEVKVPDIGDFDSVPVIDLFVKVGDTIKVDDAICTLESDKATMDVPSPVAGVVKEVLVQLGAKVGEGALLIKVDSGASAATTETTTSLGVTPGNAPKETPTAVPVAAPVAGSHAGGADLECEMLVLGAGPGGYSAAFRSADLGMKTIIVERYATLGGVCLNVGCIPSKALLHVAAVIEEAEHANDLGVTFGAPQVDIDKLRAHKDKVVGKLTGGLAGMAKGRKVDIVRGYGHFLDAHHIEVEETSGSSQEKTGNKKVIKFQKCIIAAGSAAVHLPFIPRDPRIVDSTGALELASCRRRCWSSAAASSVWKWRPSIRRWAPRSMSSKWPMR
jgi:dihydrolipoamide dehydrogenase